MKHDAKSDWEALNNTTVRTVLALFRCRNEIWDADHRVVDQNGLTWAQFLTLMMLRDTTPDHRLLPTQLYEGVQITSGGMTKVLSELEAAGLITRIPNPADRRGQFAQITAKGIFEIEILVGRLQIVNDGIFSDALTAQEIDVLFSLLNKLTKSLDSRSK